MKLCEFSFQNELKQFFMPEYCNWITFHFIFIEFDYDKFGPLFSFTCIILGLGFYISFNPSWETEQSKYITDLSNKAKENPDDYLSWKDLEDNEKGKSNGN